MNLSQFTAFLGEHGFFLSTEIGLLSGFIFFVGLEAIFPRQQNNSVLAVVSLLFWFSIFCISFVSRSNVVGKAFVPCLDGLFVLDYSQIAWKRLLCVMAFFSSLLLGAERQNYRSFCGLQAVLCLLSLCALLLLGSRHWLLIFFLLGALSLLSYGVFAWASAKEMAKTMQSYILQGLIALGLGLFALSFWILGTKSLLANSPFNGEVAHWSPILWFLVLALAWLKIGLMPFHAWVRPVYAQTGVGALAFLILVPKIAIIGVLLPLFKPFQTHLELPFGVLFALGLASVFIANSLGIKAETTRDLLAYSAISHSGLMLLSIPIGLFQESTLWLLMTSYGLSVLAFLSVEVLLGQNFEDWPKQKCPKWLLVMAFLALLGLSGLPPMGTFIAKLLLVLAFIEAMPTALGLWPVLLLLMSLLVGVYMYLKPILLFFKPSASHDFGWETKLSWSWTVLSFLFIVLSLCLFMIADAFLMLLNS